MCDRSSWNSNAMRFKVLAAETMQEWMIRMVFVLNSWVIRIFVLLSFTAHLLVVLLAGARRHMAIGVPITILWTANQLGRSATTYALSKLALGSTPQELELVTFWGAFLLLHAGGPDNITAYSMEDNVLSTRHKVEMFFQVAGALYAMYKNIVVRSGAGTMMWVSSLMFIMGIVKYWERSKAVQLGNLENMRSSIKKKKEEDKTSRGRMKNVRRPCSCENYEEALLVAHGLLDITKGAFVDCSIDERQIPEYVARRREIFPSSGWKMMYKVVDMELSLMYDILFTRTAMVHTWHGYAIRAAFPFLTATAFIMFWFDSKQGQRMADVLITYLLLASTLLLDIRWLLRAVASTWTYSFLNDRPRLWLHHAILCSGKWRLLRRLIVSLDLSLFLGKQPSSYRKWSGKIGQYNLLQECTRDKDKRTSNCLSSLVKKVASEDHWMEYEYHYLRGVNISQDGVKKQLFNSFWEYMRSAYPVEDDEQKKNNDEKFCKEKKEEVEHYCKMCCCIDEGLRAMRVRELEDALDFLPEFQESILILHIATEVFLLNIESEQTEASRSRKNMKAIKVLSDYMVFLVAVRPSMLPGLKLRSPYEAFQKALDAIWLTGKSSCSNSRTRETCLVQILSDMEKTESKVGPKKRIWRSGYRTRNRTLTFTSKLYESSIILSDGVKLADLLLMWILNRKREIKDVKSAKKFEQMFPTLMESDKANDDPAHIFFYDLAKLLKLLFNEWVRLLINASVKCTRDAHAKQLSCGGELTTIVWMLVEHAGIFRID